MKLGLIAQPYNSGIGHIAAGFAANFDHKALLMMVKPYQAFTDRFSKEQRLVVNISQSDINWLLDGIDVLLIIETPYEWSILEQAKAKGIKVCFMPMMEWMDRSRPELEYVDLFICPSKSTFRDLKFGTKIEVPSEVPVDLTKFKPRNIKRAKTFLHNAGHGGVNARNSTRELIEAWQYVKSDVKLLINTQFPIKWNGDTRITIVEGNFENYWQLYDQGDVWIMPGKYGMAYLGIQEAAATGLPIMFTDMEPFNEYLPKELLIPATIKNTSMYHGQVELLAAFDPKEIAKKIDEVAAMDLSKFSKQSLKLASAWSWQVWKDKYVAIFQQKV